MIVFPQPSCHNRLKSLNSFSVSLLVPLLLAPMTATCTSGPSSYRLSSSPAPFKHPRNQSFLRQISVTRSPDESLAGVLLPHLPQVLSEGRCLMIEGRATLGGSGVLYRSALYPLSDDGCAIDHVLGAANCRPLRENEELTSSYIRTTWL